MPTFAPIVLPHHIKKDGTVRIKIKVTQHRQHKYFDSGITADLKDLIRSVKLDKGTKKKTISYQVKTQSFKDSLDAICKQYRDKCNSIPEQINKMTVEDVAEFLFESKKGPVDLIQFARDYIKILKDQGREGSAKGYETAINTLIRFNNSDQLPINSINYDFLTRFTDFIKLNPKNAKLSSTQSRAPSLYLTSIRALHNAAKLKYNDEDRGKILIPFSPFVKFNIPKPPVTRKRAITPAQVKSIFNLPDKAVINSSGYNRFNLSKDCFFLSFALIGMNSADMYACDNIKRDNVSKMDVITYMRQKTSRRREDNAEIQIWIQPEIKALMEKYKDPTGKRVFRFYLDYSDKSTFNAAINKGLNWIPKHNSKSKGDSKNKMFVEQISKTVGEDIGETDLEFYAARHSWATIALNDAGVDKYTVHSALNHTDPDMRITEKYIKKDFKLINEANRKVLDLIFKKP